MPSYQTLKSARSHNPQILSTQPEKFQKPNLGKSFKYAIIILHVELFKVIVLFLICLVPEIFFVAIIAHRHILLASQALNTITVLGALAHDNHAASLAR